MLTVGDLFQCVDVGQVSKDHGLGIAHQSADRRQAGIVMGQCKAGQVLDLKVIAQPVVGGLALKMPRRQVPAWGLVAHHGLDAMGLRPLGQQQFCWL